MTLGILRHLRASRRAPFVAALGLLLAFVIVIHTRAPIGPGQDEHFHIMTAAIVSRWGIDAFYRELYQPFPLLDANTLVHWLAYLPGRLLGDPVRAFQVTGTFAYFVALPLATAHALATRGRWPWPALLSVPLSHGRMWSAGGFWPFLSAAPLLILALAELPIALGQARDVGARASPTRRRVATLVTALACALAFLAHATVFAWMIALLAASTTAGAVRARARGEHVRGLLLRACAIVAPAIALALAWFARTHLGAQRATGGVDLAPIPRPFSAKLTEILLPLTQTRGAHEGELVVLFLAILMFALSVRRSARGRDYELAFGLTVSSYFLFPEKVGAGQSLASRQMEIALWLLPLVLSPHPPRLPAMRSALAACLFAYSGLRLAYLGRALDDFQREIKGMRALAQRCPEPRGRVAYVTARLSSRHWDGFAMHQPHETFAALCGLDAPVYDSVTYPHSLQPLRYRGGLPAPVMILIDDRRWPEHEALWKHYDYVLVHDAPDARQLAAAEARGVRLGGGDGWELWASRERRPDVTLAP